MTIDECIAYLENVSAEKKSRSRKARQILKYLRELKERRETEQWLKVRNYYRKRYHW